MILIPPHYLFITLSFQVFTTLTEAQNPPVLFLCLELRGKKASSQYLHRQINSNTDHYLLAAILHKFPQWQQGRHRINSLYNAHLLTGLWPYRLTGHPTMNSSVMLDLGWRKSCHDTLKIFLAFLLDYTTKIGNFRTENNVTTGDLSSLPILKVTAYPLKLGT